MLIKAAVNGGRTRAEHPAVPVVLDDIVEDVRRLAGVGARVVHAHARTHDGAQTIAPGDVAALVDAVKAAVPDVLLGTTTGLWTCSGHAERMASIAAWPEESLPDFASVAFSEEGAAEAAGLVVERGMVLESAVWEMADIPALLASPTLHRNVRILIEPEDEDADHAIAHARAMAAALRDAGVTAPLLYHGYDGTAWPVIRAAIEDGVQTRVGFEDMIVGETGEPPVDNIDLFLHASRLAGEPAGQVPRER